MEFTQNCTGLSLENLVEGLLGAVHYAEAGWGARGCSGQRLSILWPRKILQIFENVNIFFRKSDQFQECKRIKHNLEIMEKLMFHSGFKTFKKLSNNHYLLILFFGIVQKWWILRWDKLTSFLSLTQNIHSRCSTDIRPHALMKARLDTRQAWPLCPKLQLLVLLLYRNKLPLCEPLAWLQSTEIARTRACDSIKNRQIHANRVAEDPISRSRRLKHSRLPTRFQDLKTIKSDDPQSLAV